DHGRIVERGTHAELLTREGIYADLYALQFALGGDGAPGDLQEGFKSRRRATISEGEETPMTAGYHATDRAVLRLTGADTREFLQNLVTNDVERLDQGMVYTALLSPQGKYLFDFFLVPDGEA